MSTAQPASSDSSQPPVTKTDDSFKTYGIGLCHKAAAHAAEQIGGIAISDSQARVFSCRVTQQSESAYLLWIDSLVPDTSLPPGLPGRGVSGKLCSDILVAYVAETIGSPEQQVILSRGNCSIPEDYAFLKSLYARKRSPDAKYRVCEYVADKAHDHSPPGLSAAEASAQHFAECAIDGDLFTLDVDYADGRICKNVVIRSQEETASSPELHEVISAGDCLHFLPA